MLADRTAVTRAKRYKVTAREGAPVNAHVSPASQILHQLPPDTVVVSAEVVIDPDGNEGQRVRISSPAGWLAADDLAPAEPVATTRLDFETFLNRHAVLSPGDRYGLEFPFTLDLLRDFGAEFLTEAFRAAGSISADNRVTAIVALEPLSLMGASENALLTVAYARPEAGLHTELFVKLPPESAGHKYALTRLYNGEVEMQRLSRQGTLPVAVAKYYFGDFCANTSNYILITERIKFGVPPIEPAYKKGYDHHIPEIDEHYRVLTTALASLVAAHKTGAMGYDVESIFPFARAARDFDALVAPEQDIDRLIDFISRVAPQLFVEGATAPEFLARWREDLLFGLAHKDEVIAYLHENVDYTGLCHPNLNPDNAWYWRDQSGALQVGLLDWGGAGQMSIAQALSGMLMMPDPDMHVRLSRDVIETFIREYADRSGVLLDRDELHLQYQASIFSTAIWIILSMIVGILPRFSEDEYRKMPDRFDRQLQESGMYSAIIWIDNMLREWLEEVTPGDACRQIVALRNAARS